MSLAEALATVVGEPILGCCECQPPSGRSAFLSRLAFGPLGSAVVRKPKASAGGVFAVPPQSYLAVSVTRLYVVMAAEVVLEGDRSAISAVGTSSTRGGTQFTILRSDGPSVIGTVSNRTGGPEVLDLLRRDA